MGKKGKVPTRWNRALQRVKYRLNAKQVTEFADEPMAKLREAEMKAERSPYSSSLDTLAEQTVLQAEKLADQLKEEAKQIRMQAQAEAARIVEEAQRTVQEQAEVAGRVVKMAAEEAQKVLEAARGKGALIEAESRRQAEPLLEHTKGRIVGQIRGDAKRASEKLLPYVDNIIKEVQALRIDLGNWETTTPGTSWPVPETPTPAPPTPPTEAQRVSRPSEPKADDTTLYEGPLQVVIQGPVYPAGLGEIYERLVKLPQITLRDTRKADDGSYLFDVSLGHPTPLVTILKQMENVAEVSVGPQPVGDHIANGSEGAQSMEEQDTTPKTRVLVKLKE